MAREKQQFKSDARQFAYKRYYKRYIEDDPERVASFEDEVANAELAAKIYDLRTRGGLSQRELAELVRTTASVICRLENSGYEGHSLSMLRRIATALNKRIDIRFVPIKRQRKAA